MQSTEQSHARLVERTMVEMYDHDCDGGHGPECAVMGRTVVYTSEGQEVTDPAIIAQVERNIAAAEEEEPWRT